VAISPRIQGEAVFRRIVDAVDSCRQTEEAGV